MSASGPEQVPGDDELSDAERKLLIAAISGALTDMRTGDADTDDPAQGASWDIGRRIRASLLTELLTGTVRADSNPPRAIKVRAARITGVLDLEAAALNCPLLLHDCYIDESVNLDQATAPAIRMPGCYLPGLTAKQLRTTGDLNLMATTFTAPGQVLLDGAHIGGQLDLTMAKLTNPGGRALDARSLTVDMGMSCQDCTVLGEICLACARIGGWLDLDGATLSGQGGTALNAHHLTVDHGMYCRKCTALGEIRLRGAHIGGVLTMNGATLSNRGGTALNAERLTVEQNMRFLDCTADGKVDLRAARVGGVLVMSRSTLTNPDGKALAAERMTVEQSMHCRDGFTAQGEVCLLGATIGQRLNLSGANLSNPGGKALDLRAAKAGILFLLPQPPVEGEINLAGATVNVLVDDPASWPATVRLRAFAYDDLANDRVSVRERLRWLTLQPGGYTPDIYDQLAAVYRRAGNNEAASKVAVAKQRRRRHPFSPLSWLWYLTVGYGYRPWLAGAWLAAFLAVGTWAFGNVHMIATVADPPAFHPFAYTADVTLPIVDLGQKRVWEPQGAALYWSWALTAAGWVLTTAVVAGLTGILKRD
jgi:hypothetical protein